MKTIILYSILISAFATVITACSKDDVQTPPDLRFPLPLFTIDTTADVFIPGEDPSNFLGKFIIDMYYGAAVKPLKVDVVVIRNDNRTDVKTITADVTSFPASIQVTGTQLTTLFDSTIKLGDKFEIGADVTTTTGQKFEAFPVTGSPYGADTTALPGSRFSIVYVTTCTFDKNSFNGQYTVVRNTIGDADWGDLKVGDLVSVRPGTAENDLVVVAYPYNTLVYPPYPMICQVNPVTLDVIVPRQLIGVPMYSYPYLWAEPGTGPGTVNPCGDAITLNMTLSAVYDIGTPYSATGILELRK